MINISMTPERFLALAEIVNDGLDAHVEEQVECFIKEFEGLRQNTSLTHEQFLDEVRQLAANYATLVDEAKAMASMVHDIKVQIDSGRK